MIIYTLAEMRGTPTVCNLFLVILSLLCVAVAWHMAGRRQGLAGATTTVPHFQKPLCCWNKIAN